MEFDISVAFTMIIEGIITIINLTFGYNFFKILFYQNRVNFPQLQTFFR